MHRRSARLGSVAIGTAAMLVLGITGAAGAAGKRTTHQRNGTHAKKTVLVGYDTEFLTDPFQVAMQKFALQDASKYHLKFLSPLDANGSLQQQLTQLHTLVAEGAKAVIINPVDAKGIDPGIRYLDAHHVAPITLDDAPFGGGAYMVVRSNNIYMGSVACEKMGHLLHGRGTVLDIEGVLATSNGLDRANGFNNCMKKHFPHIKLIAKEADAGGQWSAAAAAHIAQTVVSTTPGLSGIFEASDTTFGNAVEEVLKTHHKWARLGAKNHIVLGSIDGGTAALRNIGRGYQNFLVSQPVNLYALYADQYALRAAQGKKVHFGKVPHGKIVMYSHSPEYQLVSPVVTKANVKSHALWGNLPGLPT